jgi:hypothetical protein
LGNFGLAAGEEQSPNSTDNTEQHQDRQTNDDPFGCRTIATVALLLHMSSPGRAREAR